MVAHELSACIRRYVSFSEEDMSTKVAAVTVSRKANRVAVGAFFFMQGFIFASWASRIPDIQQRLLLSEGGLGSVLFTLPLGLMISLPLSGWLVARFGSRRMVLLAASLYVMNLPMIGLVQQTWHLVAALFLFGLSGNLLNISVNTQAVGVEALYKRSIMSSLHGLWSLAGFLAAATGTYFISLGVPPFFHFCISSAAGILLLLATYKYALPQDINHNSEQPLFAWPDSNLLKLGLIGFCGMMCEGTMFDWSGIYFSKAVQAPKELTTLGYVAFMSTMAGGRFTGDWLVARFGTRRIIQMNGLLIAAGLLISVVFPYLATATLGFLLVGVGVSTIVPLIYGAAGKTKTMSAGVALTAVSSTSFLGFLFGPPLIGFIAEASNLRWSFALVAILGFCTTFLITRVSINNQE